MSSIPTYTTLTTPIVERSSFWLTESPVHDPRTGLTWFTDIPDKSIYSFQHTSSDAQSTLRRIDVPDHVGCIALIDGDEKHLLLGAKKGAALIDVETEKVEYVNTMYEDEKVGERMRVNDGGVDVKGRFWFGSMRSFGLGPPDFEGTLWRSDTDKSLHSTISPVGVPNGIGWSPDNSIVYFTDTKKGTIFTYKFDASTGAISSEDTFINFTQQPPEKYGPGSPDGLAIDTNGDLWVAMFNGNAVLHIDAKTKEPKGKIELPTSKQVACPRFVPGGLLITTGKLVHMDPECGKSHSPHAGAVFFVKSEDIGGAQGREIYKAKLE